MGRTVLPRAPPALLYCLFSAHPLPLCLLQPARPFDLSALATASASVRVLLRRHSRARQPLAWVCSLMAFDPAVVARARSGDWRPVLRRDNPRRASAAAFPAPVWLLVRWALFSTARARPCHQVRKLLA
ncbi:unnamed protein product [Amoebophrya sp. A120]|nr:unnamed protein product [Amoebophrya sp. A120]|eukprot:GSA120T00017712001.1